MSVNCLDVPFEDITDYWWATAEGGKNMRAVKALCLWDRFFLGVQICGRKDLLHPWLYERCREVERESDDYLDLWAREHYKSTLKTFLGTIQEILRDPEITIGIFSHTAPIAKAFLKQIRSELERNEKLKSLFPEILYQDPQREAPSWSLDSGIVVKRKSNPKEATIEAHGLVDGQPTSKHFRLRIYDDVVVKESVTTPDQVAKTTEAWELSLNLGCEGGRVQYAGTRWSASDTYSDIINRGAVKVRKYPSTEDGTFSGVPVLWSVEENEKRKLQGEQTYSCQNLQNPLAGHLRMFEVNAQEYEIRPHTLNVYIMVDPARSKKKDSCNTAMVTIGVDYALNKYLITGYAHRMDLQERWAKLRELWQRAKRMPGVQNVFVGYEKFGAQADLDYFEEQMRVHGPRFEVQELAWPRDGDGAKDDRIQRLGPDLRSGKLFFPRSTDAERLTANQLKMKNEGAEYRIAKPIRCRDENGKIYDLSAKARTEIEFQPFGTRDIVDALSRIYDMEPIAPRYNEPSYAEPDFV